MVTELIVNTVMTLGQAREEGEPSSPSQNDLVQCPLVANMFIFIQHGSAVIFISRKPLIQTTSIATLQVLVSEALHLMNVNFILCP